MKFDIFDIFEFTSSIFDLWNELKSYIPSKYIKKRKMKKKTARLKNKNHTKKTGSAYAKKKARKRFKKKVRHSFERANWFLFKAESFWYQVMQIEKKL